MSTKIDKDTALDIPIFSWTEIQDMSKSTRSRLRTKLRNSGNSHALYIYDEELKKLGIQRGKPKHKHDNKYVKQRLLAHIPSSDADDSDMELWRFNVRPSIDLNVFPSFVGDIATGMSWVGINPRQFRSRSPSRLLWHLSELDTISLANVQVAGPYTASYAPKVTATLRVLSILLEREFRRRCYFVNTHTGELALIGDEYQQKVRYSVRTAAKLHAQH